MSNAEKTVGYQYTNTGPFEVSVYPTGKDSDHPGMIFVRHVGGPPASFGPKHPDDFWGKDPDEIRDIAIRYYCHGLRGDWGYVGQIYKEAREVGVEFDR